MKGTRAGGNNQSQMDERSWFGRVADLYRARRRHLRLTQVEVARRARVVQASVARLEGGRGNVTLSTLYQLARALEADVEINLVSRRRRRSAPMGDGAKTSEISEEELQRRLHRVLNDHPEVSMALALPRKGADPVQIMVYFRYAARPAILEELEDLVAGLLGRGSFYFSYLEPSQPGRYARWPTSTQGG